MTNETVNIKTFRQEQVLELIEVVESKEGDKSQIVADFFATSVLMAEFLGWETSSMFQLISKQQPVASELVGSMNEELEQ